jgi:hypothetical protein
MADTQARIKELELKHATVNRDIERIISANKSTPAYIALKKECDETEKESKKAYSELKKAKDNVNLLFLKDSRWGCASYESSDGSLYTNIRDDVIATMKKRTKFSYLRYEDIKHIVNDMIAIEMKKHPEIAELESKHKALNDKVYGSFCHDGDSLELRLQILAEAGTEELKKENDALWSEKYKLEKEEPVLTPLQKAKEAERDRITLSRKDIALAMMKELDGDTA